MYRFYEGFYLKINSVATHSKSGKSKWNLYSDGRDLILKIFKITNCIFQFGFRHDTCRVEF